MNKYPQKVVLREDYLVITESDIVRAVCLGQLIYWQSRIKDFQKFINNENIARITEGQDEIEISGWIYKDAEELLGECMLGVNVKKIRESLDWLVKKELIRRRRNPNYKWDRRYQYVVNVEKVSKEIIRHGFIVTDNLYTSILQNVSINAPESQHQYSEKSVTITETTTETTNRGGGTLPLSDKEGVVNGLNLFNLKPLNQIKLLYEGMGIETDVDFEAVINRVLKIKGKEPIVKTVYHWWREDILSGKLFAPRLYYPFDTDAIINEMPKYWSEVEELISKYIDRIKEQRPELYEEFVIEGNKTTKTHDL